MFRLSAVEKEILSLLATNGQMYGLELVHASSSIKRGTVYVTLSRMEDKGLVESSATPAAGDAGMRRRYACTVDGTRLLRAVEMAELAIAGGRYA